MLDVNHIVEDLNKKYVSSQEEYIKQIKFLKGAGYKIFRNKDGKHRVEHNPNYIYEAFGGIFRDIFK